MADYIMALDQGTTSSRAIIFDKEGRICSVKQKEFTQHFPNNGWVEHDPMEIWATQMSVMMEACIDGRPLPSRAPKRYIMLNKPRGYVTTLHDERGRKTVADLVASAGERLYPVGRLDLDSEGLLILTNDGEIANCLMHKNYTIDRFTPQDLENLEPVDIEEYLEYLKVYKRDEDGELITNGEKGLARKMSALRSFYGYYFKHRIIQKNPTLLVDMPKLHDKAIIRLDTDEVALLLDFVESAGEHLTGNWKRY